MLHKHSKCTTLPKTCTMYQTCSCFQLFTMDFLEHGSFIHTCICIRTRNWNNLSPNDLWNRELSSKNLPGFRNSSGPSWRQLPRRCIIPRVWCRITRWDKLHESYGINMDAPRPAPTVRAAQPKHENMARKVPRSCTKRQKSGNRKYHETEHPTH